MMPKTYLCPECGRELAKDQECPECGKKAEGRDLLTEEMSKPRKPMGLFYEES